MYHLCDVMWTMKLRNNCWMLTSQMWVCVCARKTVLYLLTFWNEPFFPWATPPHHHHRLVLQIRILLLYYRRYREHTRYIFFAKKQRTRAEAFWKWILELPLMCQSSPCVSRIAPISSGIVFFKCALKKSKAGRRKLVAIIHCPDDPLNSFKSVCVAKWNSSAA